MTRPSEGTRYRIVIRSECGTLLATLIDGLTIESSQGRTCVIASVRDDAEFYGLLDQFQDLALHVISLHELANDAPPG